MDRLPFLFFEQIYLVTDSIIAGLAHLGISLLMGSAIIVKSRKHSHHRALTLLLTLGGIFTLSFLIWGIFIEPGSIDVVTQEIDLEDYTGEPVHIALISDAHLGRFNNTNRFVNALDTIKSRENITHLLILGDVVNTSNEHLHDLDHLGEVASDIDVFFIYGNHDYTTHLRTDEDRTIIEGLPEKLHDLGVTILENDSAQIITSENHPIVLAGIADLWANQYSFEMLDHVDPNQTCILMSHNPDVAKYLHEEYEQPDIVDLIVSGHTHSGEMHLPFIGPLWHLPIKIPQSYDEGFFSYEDTPLFITSGLGNIGVRMRTMNPPEVVILTII